MGTLRRQPLIGVIGIRCLEHSVHTRREVFEPSSIPCPTPVPTPSRHPFPPTQKLIFDVLSALPSQREARHFLRRFDQQPEAIASPIPPPEPAILADSARSDRLGIVCLEPHLDWDRLVAFAGTLVRLRTLGLTPVVVVDSGAVVEEDDVGDEEEEDEGREVHAREAAIREVFRVVEAIEKAGGRAMGLYNGVLNVAEEAGSGAEGLTLALAPIHAALSLNQIPVLAPTACTSPASTRMLVPTRSVLLSLARALSDSSLLGLPVKAIFANSSGGLTVRGRPVSFVNLEDEYDEMRTTVGTRAARAPYHEGPNETPDDALAVARETSTLDTLRALLAVLPRSASAVVTSADSSTGIIANLITDKPAPLTPHPVPARRGPTPPTLLRHGLPVTLHTSLTTLPLPRLTTLLDLSFQKSLLPTPFYTRLETVLDAVIMAGDFDGAAIVTKEVDPFWEETEGEEERAIAYLDKFAVRPDRQGSGVADVLWKRLRRRYPDLVWRSRADNPVNKWYFDRSDGNLKLPGGHWMMFWYGPHGLGRLNSYREATGSIPRSFAAPGESAAGGK
ncbi:hypothetical protein BDK51DRAFT_31939 [Blyttiomyces helicus]|uniref:Amino-acid acetyltransferase, mitochondrial n=1 Tax=Blyttiomyces helicus TaxID=388810 RepID=A0A4P9WIF5_9FUNG|nr:hypothetical protein BDK51DRAFT_31939 [Blyttiomyces helicus]|eukprot:RKO92202.1 hypothetical protein BDK51DRAFT_31939 [Blyttiomyces helicus]